MPDVCKSDRCEQLRNERKQAMKPIEFGCAVAFFAMMICMIVVSVGIYKWLATDYNKLSELESHQQRVEGRLEACEYKLFGGSMSDATTKD